MYLILVQYGTFDDNIVWLPPLKVEINIIVYIINRKSNILTLKRTECVAETPEWWYWLRTDSRTDTVELYANDETESVARDAWNSHGGTI